MRQEKEERDMPERFHADSDAQGMVDQYLVDDSTDDLAQTSADDVVVSRITADSTGNTPNGANGSIASDTDMPSPFQVRLTVRLTPRRRAVAAGTAIGAVALALLVILGTIPGAGPTLGAALGIVPPTPTPTLIPGADMVFFANSVPWGKLTVDGYPTKVSPPAGRAYPQVRLSRGTHHLVYTAAPFPPVRCRVSVPSAKSDTCPPAVGILDTIQTDSSAYRSIDLQATPDNLPPDQYAALVRAAQAAFAVPDGTVPAGDHYRDSNGNTVVAASPLAAHLVITVPEKGTDLGGINGAICDPLCVNSLFDPANIDQWQVAALAALAWQFTTHDRQMIESGSSSQDVMMPLMLYVEWSGAWSVSLANPNQLSQEVCSPVGAELGTLLTSPSKANYGFSFESHPDSSVMDGCLTQVFPSLPVTSGTGPGDPPPLNILYRFGALVAADAATAQALPQLPAASANERALVARLGASTGSGSGRVAP